MDATNTRETNMQWQADLACRTWTQTLSKMFDKLTDAFALGQLGIRNADGASDCTREAASDFFQLIVSAVSKRAWSMMIWSEVSPLSWAGLLHKNTDRVSQKLSELEEEQSVIVEAWDYLTKKEGDWKAWFTT